MLTLYTDSSPNGFKATIAPGRTRPALHPKHVHINQGEHRQPDFLRLNPHGRIPVLTDDETGITLFESAAILLYLAEKTGRLLPAEPRARWQATQWLIFHAASVGPLIGQRVHFEIFAAHKDPIAIERYRRLTTKPTQRWTSTWPAASPISPATNTASPTSPTSAGPTSPASSASTSTPTRT